MTRCAQLDAVASATVAGTTCLLNAINRRVGTASQPEAVKYLSCGGYYPACGPKFVRSYTYRHALPRKSL